MDPLRKKWKDVIRTNLEYYIANVNHECWVLYKARRFVYHIQPYLITNTSSICHRALTLLHTHRKNQILTLHHGIKTNQIAENAYYLFFTCSIYSAIQETYDDILRGDDDSSDMLKRTLGRLSSYVYALLTHLEFLIQSMNKASQEGDTHRDNICAQVLLVKNGLSIDGKHIYLSIYRELIS